MPYYPSDGILDLAAAYGVVPANKGGTGITTYAVGDFIYASSATALSRLAIGTNNYVLTSNGTLPVWTQNTGTGNVARATLPQFTSTIGVGVAASASGSGVSFPATQSPSTDANTLDDYEEGTWTPVVTAASGTITAYTASGSYTKVGRQVHATIQIAITNNGTGAGSVNATLPFTAAAPYFTGCGREIASTGKALQGLIAGSTASVLIYNYDNSYPGGTGFTIIMAVSYYV